MTRATLTAAGVVLVCALFSPAALADNAIQRENANPGTTAWNGAGSSLIEAYASQISVAPGDEIDVHVNTRPAARYRIEVYRLGWYGGAGGRLMTCIPSCGTDRQGGSSSRCGRPRRTGRRSAPTGR